MPTVADRLYNAEQVRRLDACAIDEQGIPGYTLMQRAGTAVFEAARSRFTSARRWLVLCGGGNNAGDGYVVATLASKAGLDVALYALKEPRRLTGDAAAAARDWRAAGGRVRAWPPKPDLAADLVIDALLGTGLDRDVGGAYQEALALLERLQRPVVSVDVPSGIHADTGRVMGRAVRADVTVSFIGQKRGLFTADGPDHRGELVFDDLGTPLDIHARVGKCGWLIREPIIRNLLPGRALNSHKGDYGHVLIGGGTVGMSGAVRLAGEAALRSGAGLVTLATHPAHAGIVNVTRPELMVAAIGDGDDLTGPMERASVLAVGPGLGQSDWSRRLFTGFLGSDLPLVVDADGLNLLAQHPAERAEWVLTPHPAEAARLAGCTTADIQSDRVSAALRLAGRFQAVVVLKGCGTVLAAPDGEFAICPLGNPGMATAGSGDVLTGVIAGLMGQGLKAWQAAVAGVVAHAASGDRVAATRGRRGMIASDICETLPQVLDG